MSSPKGLDYAIRFGDGAWHGCEAALICEAPMSPLCAPQLAQLLREPADLMRLPLLRSYRPQDWLAWFKAARLDAVNPHGPLFDSSLIMAQAAIRGGRRRAGALWPVSTGARRRSARATIFDRR